MRLSDVDFGPLERMWIERARRVAEVRRRADPTGMTRPARDPAERAWLRREAAESPFVEIRTKGKSGN